MERLAVFVNEHVFQGTKSCAEGIDLEFKKDQVKYIVAIKSGPNWGNSSQIKKMIDNFNRAKKILKTSGSFTDHTIAVNGCCYGIDNKPDKGQYIKYCGQRFWHFISGDKDLYTRIISPLGHQAKERNEAFHSEYARIINQLVNGFIARFCKNGRIDWIALIKYNSGVEA